MAEQTLLQSVVLLYEGRRHPVGPDGLTLGRSEDNDVPLAAERASRRHARVAQGADGLVVEDLGSTHGTSVNGGEVFHGESRPLAPGDRIEIGGALVRILGGGETRFEGAAVGGGAVEETAAAPMPEQAVAFDGTRLSIGRQEGNDLVLPDPNVSRAHAELVRAADGGAEVVDLGSRNGTRLDGAPVERARLEPGSVVGIGPYQLHFDGERLVARDTRAELRMHARDVAVVVGDGKSILKPVSLDIEPGELVVLIGESGAGKSTLLKVLAGVNAPSGGSVAVNGEPLGARLTDVGYVPQDEIVHPQLTVREALRYAAQLRLPQDTSDEEIDATVERVVAELSLERNADTRIGSLSGGQRKRTGVAAELLSRPSLLFLDEPTTGLDPGLEGRLMKLLRELADGGRGVTVVTHATSSLTLVDRLVVMGRGGERTFEGSPDEALAFFGVSSFEEIYEALDAAEPNELRARFEGGRDGTAAPAAEEAPARTGSPRRRPKLLKQTGVLAARQARLMLRDRQNLALVFGQVPVLALLNGLIFGTHIFRRGPAGSPGDAIQFMYLLVLVAIWFGALGAAREIVKERALRERESAIGVRLDAYLMSKCAVLFAMVSLQVVLMMALVFAMRPLHASAGTYVGVFVLFVATGIAATGLGLLVSAVVTTEDQAMTIVPLVLIPQIVFAGAVVPIERMLEPFKALSYLHLSQWSLSSLGTRIQMNGRMASSPEFARVNRFGTHFFDVGLGAGVAIMVGFLAVFVGITAFVLHRRNRHG